MNVTPVVAKLDAIIEGLNTEVHFAIVESNVSAAQKLTELYNELTELRNDIKEGSKYAY